MHLAITTTHTPATDLGYLLGKNPNRAQSFTLPFGVAHVVYSEATPERCTAHLLVDLDPIALVKGRRRAGDDDSPLAQYVNDRAYAASSFLTVAMTRALGSALKGTSRERPELALTAIPLEIKVAAVRLRGGERFVRELFEPLGYVVSVVSPQPADDGQRTIRYGELTLNATMRLSDALTQLYVLLPVLDGDKHYFVGDDEVDKLVAGGAGWLESHPCRDVIVRRYLKDRRSLVESVGDRLTPDATAEPAPEAEEDPPSESPVAEANEAGLERRISLDEARRVAVLEVLRSAGVTRVVDVGCGEGKLLAELSREPRFQTVAGMDVSLGALERAKRRLGLEHKSPTEAARFQLFQGALGYRDARLRGFEAACVIEVIEHLDAWRLPSFEQALFGDARPGLVIVTTPNVEYNALFVGLATTGRLRHRDHRFEWTRAEFAAWAHAAATEHRYTVALGGIGTLDETHGHPTQMAIFTSAAAPSLGAST